jgi:TolB-like protein
LKLFRSPLWHIFMSASLFILLSGQASWAAQPKRVLIMPFAIHSEKDISFLKEGIWEMLSSRLYQEGKVSIVDKIATQTLIGIPDMSITEAMAVSAAKKIGADYVLLGSLTVFGETISTDAKFIDATTGRSKVTFSRSGQQRGDVILHMQALAQNINEAVFGAKAPVQQQPLTKSQDAADNRMNPEKLWEMESGGEKEKKPAGPAPVAPGKKFNDGAAIIKATPAPAKTVAGPPAPDSYTSSDFKLKIRGIASGDVDGDGQPEIVFISAKAVYIYRFTGSDLKEVQTIKGNRSDNYISVDVADINQNGNAEIFVVNFLTGDSRLASFVLEYGQGNYHTVADNQRWYYRVIHEAGSGDRLLGQQRSREDEFFSGPVHRLSWSAGNYASTGTLSLPSDTTLYEVAFGKIFNDDRTLTATYASGGRLQILDQNGNDVHVGADAFGEGAVELEFSYNAPADAKAKDTYYIPQRIQVGDFNNTGENEIAVVKNKDAAGGLFKRLRIYKSGRIQILSWKGGEFKKVFETPETPGHISDYAVTDMDGNGQKELLYAVVKSGNILPGKERSCIVLQSLTLRK